VGVGDDAKASVTFAFADFGPAKTAAPRRSQWSPGSIFQSLLRLPGPAPLDLRIFEEKMQFRRGCPRLYLTRGRIAVLQLTVLRDLATNFGQVILRLSVLGSIAQYICFSFALWHTPLLELPSFVRLNRRGRPSLRVFL
jgi:hypothetical protein